MSDPLTHPGQLCAAGDRAADLALELGQARPRLARYEAQEARIRALHVRLELPAYAPLTTKDGEVIADGGPARVVCSRGRGPWPCRTIAALDEPEAPP